MSAHLGALREHGCPSWAISPRTASNVERPKKDCTTIYQVKWRQNGKWQTKPARRLIALSPVQIDLVRRQILRRLAHYSAPPRT
ncbi:hypothetical protein [Streptomyces sp. NPDC052042]|uniref:hypothetical protein n=1 Tax=Streptomyces sp. NPDC052042 TaxID=3365683 RepID=UPI0037CF913B